MRRFFVKLYKNIIWIYLIIIISFSYSMFMKEIPSHIYVDADDGQMEELAVPVSFFYKDYVHEYNGNSCGPEGIGFQNQYTILCKLFGLIPIKEVNVSVIPKEMVYAPGHILGIYGKTDGMLVVGTTVIEDCEGNTTEPSKGVIYPGDYILAVDGIRMNTKEEVAAYVADSMQESISLSIRRNGKNKEVKIPLMKAKNGKHYMGIWIKDDMAGIGTLTYVDLDGEFGALGHGVGNGQNGELLDLMDGRLYEASLSGIRKGVNGNPGELEGIIYYNKQNYIGTVEQNERIGIYGSILRKDEFLEGDELYEIGYKQEIKKEEAYIISDISGERKAYKIMIDGVDYREKESNKGIRFHVVDDTLLDLTGGIIQGMSGSPIIQNYKLIGAVTHVLINDSAKGYGIFIETMLEKNQE